jgi:hypothetical protein
MTTQHEAASSEAIEAPKKRVAIRWASREATVEATLGGMLFPYQTGIAWTPDQGHRLETLERHDSRAFYALTRIEGGCDIIVADASGLRMALVGEIPSAIIAKAFAYSDGSFNGELIVPIRIGNGIKATASSTPNPGHTLCNEQMQRYLWNTPPEEH